MPTPRLTRCLFFVLSFAAHCEVVAVEADAQSRQQYAGVLTKTMATITALYVVLSVFAFACFGGATSPNIMLNLGSDIYVNLVRVTVSCTLLVNIAMVRRQGQAVQGGRRGASTVRACVGRLRLRSHCCGLFVFHFARLTGAASRVADA